jgi:hypothetical protein
VLGTLILWGKDYEKINSLGFCFASQANNLNIYDKSWISLAATFIPYWLRTGLEVDRKTGGADGEEGEQVDEGGGGGGGRGEKDVWPRPTPMASWPAKEENKGAFKRNAGTWLKPYSVAKIYSLDQISIKKPNPKCRLFLKIYQ